MKEPNRAPIFACLYPGLCHIARNNGYALAIHGTVVNDLDLIAVPWTDQAIDAVELKDALLDHVGACGYADLLRRNDPHLSEDHVSQILHNEKLDPLHEGEVKPHGRLAWNLYLHAGTKIDLSILPRNSPLITDH